MARGRGGGRASDWKTGTHSHSRGVNTLRTIADAQGVKIGNTRRNQNAAGGNHPEQTRPDQARPEPNQNPTNS